jgi:hypothetical protein
MGQGRPCLELGFSGFFRFSGFFGLPETVTLDP